MRIRPGSTKPYGTDLQCDLKTSRRFPPRFPSSANRVRVSDPISKYVQGQCCEIMTGAPLPHGADAVVMVENTQRLSPTQVRILKSVRENEGLLRRGAEARKGERILQAGRKIGLADLGLLAGTGKPSVLVSRKPRVAVIATGDEFVEVDTIPQPVRFATATPTRFARKSGKQARSRWSWELRATISRI